MDFLNAYSALIELSLLNFGLAYSQYLFLKSGLFSVASPGLIAAGAYTAGILATRFGVPPALCVFAAACVGCLVSLVLSIPLARLRGVFQAIATLAFVQIVVSITLYAEPLTGGAMGLNGIPKVVGIPECLLFAVAVLLLIRNLTGSKIGRAFDAIRQDETAAVSFGIAVARYHTLAFGICGALAGVTGGMVAFNSYTLTPEQFGFPMVIAGLTFVILGGTQTLFGPALGTLFLTVLPEIARPLTEYRLLVEGLLLVCVICYLQHGLADTVWFALRSRRFKRDVAGAHK